ncbi:aspartate/glutamate racemase family protein [Ornithinimicrobium avium]|uniref:Aspartate/glutamate racemase family protein n=2 Tax=Ornithinimicrobium avium TaxID=2283195 RepID=A0A345NSL3_9MICO|nr:aspartate/glutamate racemase family protein [Ornithinimicrobium avium]
MGSAATVAFLDALVRATPARTDQEHIDSVVLNHATVPDRTARLNDPSQPDPTPYLLGDLQLLARLGADRAVILCNTAHAFLDEEDLPLPLLSIVEVGADAVMAVARASGGERPTVTVLATDGTLASRLYQDALERRGATVRVPGEADQPRVMSMIYDGVKADVPVPTEEFAALVDELGAGSDAVLLGCTELSVLFAQAATEDRPLPDRVVDAQSSLVARVVEDLGPQR